MKVAYSVGDNVFTYLYPNGLIGFTTVSQLNSVFLLLRKA